MELAIITDSTSDLSAAELSTLGVRRVPLYISFRGETRRDWEEIRPGEILEGVAAGAELPTTSQPSPQDFEAAYRAAIEEGAKQVLCITISAELSGTYQSAHIAAGSVDVPVTVFDSRGASAGVGDMVRTASRLRAEGRGMDEIVRALEKVRDTNHVLFTVAGLEFLQKGGRIGRAQALVGSLLNIKPLLSLEDGLLIPIGRARGNKKALKELVQNIEAYRAKHEGDMVLSYLYVQDESAAAELKAAVDAAGVRYRGGALIELGAVIAAHVGPGTYGAYMHIEPEA